MAYACVTSSQKAEGGRKGSAVQRQPGLRDTLSQQENKSINSSFPVHKVNSYHLFYPLLSVPRQLENRIKFFYFQFSNELSFPTESV